MRHLPRIALAGALACLALLFAGCSIRQDVVRVASKPTSVCLIEHPAVRKAVLDALAEGFERHHIEVRTTKGEYRQEKERWLATWQPEDTQGCDAIVTYVANWTWDLRMYMVYAEIAMKSPDGSVALAEARYDATLGGGRLDKFVNAREKLIELVDEMIIGPAKRPKKG